MRSSNSTSIQFKDKDDGNSHKSNIEQGEVSNVNGSCTLEEKDDFKGNDSGKSCHLKNGEFSGKSGKNVVEKSLKSQKISLIEKLQEKISLKDAFFSLEFFPPRTGLGAIKWSERIERMKRGNPLFCDITWHPTETGIEMGEGSDETSSIRIARTAVESGLEVMLHITCINMTEELLIKYLKKAKEIGIRNILALRGDIPEREATSSATVDKVASDQAKNDQEPNGTMDKRANSKELEQEKVTSKEQEKVSSNHLSPQRFKYAVDMVKFIRSNFGNEFTIAVAGYPHGHPESESLEQDLVYLKQKVDSGADLMITQLFFDVSTFVSFVTSCRSIGITIPIIPGILPIRSGDSLRHIVKLSKLTVPRMIEMEIESRMKNSPQSILEYGRESTTRLALDLLSSGYAPGIHFYTLNQDEPTVSVLKGIGLWREVP